MKKQQEEKEAVSSVSFGVLLQRSRKRVATTSRLACAVVRYSELDVYPKWESASYLILPSTYLGMLWTLNCYGLGPVTPVMGFFRVPRPCQIYSDSAAVLSAQARAQTPTNFVVPPTVVGILSVCVSHLVFTSPDVLMLYSVSKRGSCIDSIEVSSPEW